MVTRSRGFLRERGRAAYKKAVGREQWHCGLSSNGVSSATGKTRQCNCMLPWETEASRKPLSTTQVQGDRPCRLPAREQGREVEPAAPAAPAELAPGECSDSRRAAVEEEARRELASVSRMHTSAIWLEASDRSRVRRSSCAS